jgi:hypothetical protein
MRVSRFSVSRAVASIAFMVLAILSVVVLASQPVAYGFTGGVSLAFGRSGLGGLVPYSHGNVWVGAAGNGRVLGYGSGAAAICTFHVIDVKVWTSKAVYGVGEEVIVYWSLIVNAPGEVTLTGPSGTYDYVLSSVAQGYLDAGQTQQEDVGSWNVYLAVYGEADCPPTGEGSTTFQVGQAPPSVGVPLGSSASGVYSSSATLGFEETNDVFDNSGAGYLIAQRSPPKTVFISTDSTRVAASGQLLFSPDYSNAMVVAGPLANPTTGFYEGNGYTPLTFALSGGNAVFMQGGAAVLTVSLSSLSSTNDYFMEAFMDGSHTVVLMYGINAPGTLASGVYFYSQVAPNPGSYPASAYIVQWQGANPNVPLPSDTYKIVYPP